MRSAVAVVLAAEGSDGSGSPLVILIWLSGTVWAVSFLRRRREIGRLSASLVCLIVWPLIAIWTLGSAVLRRGTRSHQVPLQDGLEPTIETSPSWSPRHEVDQEAATADLRQDNTKRGDRLVSLAGALGALIGEVGRIIGWVAAFLLVGIKELIGWVGRILGWVARSLLVVIKDILEWLFPSDAGHQTTSKHRHGQPIRSPRGAEEASLRLLQQWGFNDLALTPNGKDGGMDVLSPTLAVQVKWNEKTEAKITRPKIQELVGAADNKHAVFFAYTSNIDNPPYTSDALEWAAPRNVALFGLMRDGRAVPHNAAAERLCAR
jgi:hypothetical protein